jgi:hypothetical protein
VPSVRRAVSRVTIPPSRCSCPGIRGTLLMKIMGVLVSCLDVNFAILYAIFAQG